MAVNAGDKGGNNNGVMRDALTAAGLQQPAAGSQQQQVQQPQQQAPFNQQTRSGGSLMDIQSRLPRFMSRASTGESVAKYLAAFKELLKSEGENTQYRLIVLDNQVRQTALSCILVCLADNAGGKTFVAVHTMIVEGSGNRLNSRQFNIAGQNVEIVTTAGDVADGQLWDIVRNAVAQEYGQVEISDAGTQVIPMELDAADAIHTRNVLYFACEAAFTTLDNAMGNRQQPICVTEFGRSDRLCARIDYNPLPVETAAGLPVRSDISITLNASNPTQADTIHSKTIDFSRVDGYVDLVYCPPKPAAYGQMPMTQHYYPRFIMTNFNSLLNANTMELNLLAIGSSTMLSKNLAWAGTFKPRYGAGINLRNIGAIGLDVPALTGDATGKGAKIDTQSAAFTNDSLYTLITTAIHRDLTYSADIDEAGEMSWLHLAFIAAASGNQDAYRLVIDACNNLTDGHFGRCFAGGPIAQDDLNRIHLGYWTDETGRKRDLRDIDYLALLNHMGEADMGVCIDWANTFDQISVPLEIRLEKRAKILNNVLGDSMRIKGYARRLTFTAAFVEALSTSLQLAGLVIQPSNLQFEFGGGTARGNEGISAFAVSGAGANALFNYSQPTQQHRGLGGVQYRWGR